MLLIRFTSCIAAKCKTIAYGLAANHTWLEGMQGFFVTFLKGFVCGWGSSDLPKPGPWAPETSYYSDRSRWVTCSPSSFCCYCICLPLSMCSALSYTIQSILATSFLASAQVPGWGQTSSVSARCWPSFRGSLSFSYESLKPLLTPLGTVWPRYTSIPPCMKCKYHVIVWLIGLCDQTGYDPVIHF